MMSQFDDCDSNPFEDLAIVEAMRPTQNAQEAVNEYKPYGQSSPEQPAVLQAAQAPPSYNRDSTVTMNPQQLEAYEASLKKRETDLIMRERALAGSSQSAGLPNNWPPIPEICGITPCFRHDIDNDIKPEFQSILRRLYQLWTLNEAMLILNVFGAFLLLTVFGEIVSFGVSVIYLVIFSPLSFLCWYRPVYKAFRDDSSAQFMVFFFVFFFQFLVTSFMAIGILSSGSCGIWKAIECLRTATVGGKVVGAIVLLISLGFAATAGIELFLLSRMLQIYRGSGATVEKARKEFASGILKDPTVQSAARDFVGSAVQSEINNLSKH